MVIKIYIYKINVEESKNGKIKTYNPLVNPAASSFR